MADMLHIFRGRKASFFVELAAAVIALAGIVYYAVQSNADDCFDLLYMVLMCCGVIAVAAHALLRFEFLLPAAGVLFGGGLGVMVYDMLPTMSDVWNGVHFIGGNLTAYIVYTAVSFVVVAAVICCCFIGTEKAE